MTAPAALDPALESLLAFWAEAGVDAAVEDETTDKLRRPEPPRAAGPVRAPAVVSAGAAATDLTGAVAAAQALAEAAADWPSLLAAAERFDPGALRPTGARGAVLGRGDAPAEVVVIGGVPGAEEEQAGAFAGGAGRLLDRMMTAAGLTGRALLLHAVLWRTPGGRAPTAEEAALARPFLDRAVALAQPKAVLVMGEVPARIVLGREGGVMKLRREALAWPGEIGGESPPAFVTFGPEFLLKHREAKKRAWNDLLSLTERVALAGNDP